MRSGGGSSGSGVPEDPSDLLVDEPSRRSSSHESVVDHLRNIKVLVHAAAMELDLKSLRARVVAN